MTELSAPGNTNLGASGVPTRTTSRDFDAARHTLQGWFAELFPDRPGFELVEVHSPGATGVANETLICDTRWSGPSGPEEAKYVVRVHSPDYLWLGADLTVHRRMYETLAGVPGVPVPKVIGHSDDTTLLGERFFVMEHIEGRTPGDTPPYHTGGWVAELSTDERHAMWSNAVQAMVNLHRADISRFDFLQRPALGPTGLEQHLNHWFNYEDWARAGRDIPVIASAHQWLVDHLPEHRPTSLAWGDSRLENVIFVDGEVRAILDWDEVSLAGPESDLAWWTIMDFGRTLSAGVERLPGIGSPQDTVRLWQELMGREAVDLDYQMVFASYRLASIMVRLGDLLGASGMIPAEVAADLAVNNSGIQYLSTMLDLPPAGEIITPWPGFEL